jgi:Ca2+-binding RTX toxin-like protein
VLSNIENIISGSGADLIVGSALANQIDGAAGVDTIQAGDGNDWILYDAADASVDGGGGIDTLAIRTNAVVDFDQIPNNRLTGFEEIDITGYGVQQLLLGSTDVFDLSDSSDTLKIHGGLGDKVTLAGDWVLSGTQPVIYNGAAAVQYKKYTYFDAVNNATATVLLEPNIQLEISYEGTDAAADVRIYNPADIKVDGKGQVGNPEDTLRFAPTASQLILDMVDPNYPS